MKRKLLINQYESVRSLIVVNVDTMINLVKQAESLTELANSLKEYKSQQSEETANKIEEIAAGLRLTMKDLLEKKGELFDEYYKFAEEVFDN